MTRQAEIPSSSQTMTNSLMMNTNWVVEAQHNMQSSVDYINALFLKYSRILVVRIDLSFGGDSRGQFDPDYCKGCFTRFMNNQRFNSLFSTRIGYIWALEFGQNKGFHYHCLFFFDGSLSQQDITLGLAIGMYWKNNITQGMGTFYCSNLDKECLAQQGVLGIGMIQRDDLLTRNNLLLATSYLMKVDALIPSALPPETSRFRTFGRGEMSI